MTDDTGKVSQDQIDRAKSNIVEVIRRHLPIKKTGKNWSACCPFHKENSPSFTVSEEKGFFYCLSGETQVTTWDGRKAIKALAGGKHRIITSDGRWVDAPILSFGEQPIMEIRVSRNGRTKTIRATPEHRWFVKRVNGAVITSDLKPGQYLESCQPERALFTPSREGIMHGIVYGDGCLQHGYGHVNLHGQKMELASLFSVPSSIRLTPNQKPYRRVYGGKAFGHMKNLPPLSSSADYLAGFLAGYIATDGCVDTRGSVILNSAKRLDMEFVELICLRLGIGTGETGSTMRIGYGTEPTELFRIDFYRQGFDERLLLRSTHLERWRTAKSPKPPRSRWRIVDVSKVMPSEEVFCAYVEETHSFVIDGGILTGNCHGCGESGDAVDFVVKHTGVSFRQAVESINGGLSLESSATDRPAVKRAIQCSLPGHAEDREKTARVLHNCDAAYQHQYLLRNNTAPDPGCLISKGKLLVLLINNIGETVNAAGISADGSIKYAAGAPSFGSTAIIDPAGDHDGRTIICADYAHAWRLWWANGCNARVLCTMSADNLSWMLANCRDRFTHVGCDPSQAEEYQDIGHDVVTLPLDPYTRVDRPAIVRQSLMA